MKRTARPSMPKKTLAKRWVVQERPVAAQVGSEELEAVRQLLASGESLSWGRTIEEFESEFCDYVGAQHSIASSSCTTALHLATQILRLGPSDEIICTPQTFWGQVIAPFSRGVKFRFADIDPRTLNLDPNSIPSLITDRTKAIYLVHYGGLPADLGSIRKIASDHSLAVVEDCAHATGAELHDSRIGDGDLCCFSFDSLKNMTAFGGGGVLCTKHITWANEARKLRAWGVIGPTKTREEPVIGPYRPPSFFIEDHSQESWKRRLIKVDEVGNNFGMTSIQAAVARVQLRKLDNMIERRRAIAKIYDEAALAVGLIPVSASERVRSAHHLYTCLIPLSLGINRDALIQELQEKYGIEIILRYFPLHLLSEFEMMGHRPGEAPLCERVFFSQQLNLPICSEMLEEEVERVATALRGSVEHLLRS